eukprot:COSAG02_NODE_17555_length_995_cov_1.573661_1_plen_155_part_01
MKFNGKRLIEVARGSMVVRKVVELSATRPAAPSSFHASFRCDGESRAELLDDAAVRGALGGRRRNRKLPPGMARRSSRHWASGVPSPAPREVESVEPEPKPERAPQRRRDLEVSGIPSTAPREVESVEPEPEPEPNREQEPEPPSIGADLTQLLS